MNATSSMNDEKKNQIKDVTDVAAAAFLDVVAIVTNVLSPINSYDQDILAATILSVEEYTKNVIYWVL